MVEPCFDLTNGAAPVPFVSGSSRIRLLSRLYESSAYWHQFYQLSLYGSYKPDCPVERPGILSFSSSDNVFRNRLGSHRFNGCGLGAGFADGARSSLLACDCWRC